MWGQEIVRSVTEEYNKLKGPRTPGFGTLSLSMYSSSHPAEHRFPVWWTGDVHYTELLDNVHKMVNGGTNLQPYVHPDCGAHYGAVNTSETPEMFVRWVQFCSMGTIIRIHSNTCCDHRPWTWGWEAEDAIRDTLKRRYALIPALVAAGKLATADGTPVVARLDLEFPALGPDGASRADQYTLAKDLLVAPIIPFNGSAGTAVNPTNGACNRSRTVWVPPGDWQDAWSNATITGPKLITVADVPMSQIPMWHRKGSMMVTTEPGLSTSEQDWSALNLEVFPFKHGSKGGVAHTEFYDTKLGDTHHRSTLKLNQGVDGNVEVAIGAGARDRVWRIRVHLAAEETVQGVDNVDVSNVNDAHDGRQVFTAAVDADLSFQLRRGQRVVEMAVHVKAGNLGSVHFMLAGYTQEQVQL